MRRENLIAKIISATYLSDFCWLCTRYWGIPPENKFMEFWAISTASVLRHRWVGKIISTLWALRHVFSINPLTLSFSQLKCPPTWSLVALADAISSFKISEWKLFKFVKLAVKYFQIWLLLNPFRFGKIIFQVIIKYHTHCVVTLYYD